MGKIALRIAAAWASRHSGEGRRAGDFAHADRSSGAPLPTLRHTDEVIA
jgi:hypothetical protein